MKYSQFKTKNNIEISILLLLGIIKNESKIIQIDHHPDFDLSNYAGFAETTYFFRDSWNFLNAYSAIMLPKIKHIGVFHYDDVRRLASEYKIPFNDSNTLDASLNFIKDKNIDLMLDESLDPSFDGFKLHNLRISRTDQLNKKLEFEGGYIGASDTIDPQDWHVFVECSFYGFTPSASFGKFYADLLAESFALREAGNNKISYFITFSAFENYINECLNTHNQEGRLKDKLAQLFRDRFGELNSHQIYTCTAGDFDNWENIRNGIAHGKNANNITKEDVGGLTKFVLTLMASIEKHTTCFEDLFNTMPKISHK